MKKMISFQCISLFLTALLLCVQLSGCGSAEQPLTLADQLDLGTRYLSDLDYENAVIAFAAAIEIDPKSAQAYAGLYATYTAQGNTEKADETWTAMMEAGVPVEDVLSWIEKMADLITEGGGDGEAVKLAAQEKAQGDEGEQANGAAGGTAQTTGADGTTPAYIALQQKQIELSIMPTDIMADMVINYDGYGSLKTNEERDDVGRYAVSPQAALINSSGEFVFPYLDTMYRYVYNDGVVSLWNGNFDGYTYLLENESEENHRYYNIDGTQMLQVERVADTEQLIKSYAENYSFSDEVSIDLMDSYAELHPFGDGVAFVRWGAQFHSWAGGAGGVSTETDECYLIDKQGKILLTFPEEFSDVYVQGDVGYGVTGGVGYFSEGLILVGSVYQLGNHVSDVTVTDRFSKDWSYGFMDHSGNMVIPQIYSGAGNFSEGLAAVWNADGVAGYIDKSGNTVVPFEYNSAYPFTDGLAAVSKDGKTGYINVQNEIVIPFDYDNGFTAGGGVCPVAKDGYYGLIDYNGNEVLPCEYDDISTCVEGVVYAIKDRQVYIITINQQ